MKKLKSSIVLKQYQVDTESFYNILEMFSGHVHLVDNLEPFYKGYPNKQDILYDGEEKLICLEHILDYATGMHLKDAAEWKQVVVRANHSPDADIIMTDMTGTMAWNLMIRALKQFYTLDEIKKCMNYHQCSDARKRIQYHYVYPDEENYVSEHKNCYVYDINGAHADALTIIFPKAKDAIMDMYRRRKKNPQLKAVLNYFVGMMKRKGFPLTYNWVVDRTTAKLYDALDYCDGTMVYANTDGFIVSNPRRLLAPSQELGAFKCEYTGKVYTYTDKNYYCIQYGGVTKGSVRNAVRDRIDLRRGRVVHYDITRVGNVMKLVNVVQEVVNVG